MGNYGQYSNKAKARKGWHAPKIFDYIVVLMTIGCSALLLLSYLSPLVNPNDFWLIALLGLIAPILYIIDIVLMLYLLICWKVYFFIPLVVLAMGFGDMSLFFRPDISKSYHDTKQDKAAFNVMSYNVMGFINPHNNRGESALDEITEFINTNNPDILCMQEYQSTKKMPQTKIDRLLSSMPYKRVYYKMQNRDSTGWGLAVFSRFPIIRGKSVDFEESNNSAMWVDIVIQRDTIRVFNNHLQTTSINRADRDFITTQEFVQSNRDVNSERIRNIIGKLRQNYKIRAQQADTIAIKISESPYPVVVCGDFNDTPMSYSYHTIRGDLHDAFQEKGRGVTNTYRGLFNLFRIDYILYSPAFKATNYSTPQSDWSDHNPVVVSMRLPIAESESR